MRVIDSLKDEKFNIHTCALSKSTMHTHAFFELAYVVSGEARHFLNGNERIIAKGDYFIMDYDSKHSYMRKGEEKFELINCLFVSDFIDQTIKDKRSFSDVVNNFMIKHNNSVINISPTNVIFHDEDGYIGTLLNKCIEEYKNKDSGHLEIIRSKIIEIIILTMRKNSAATPVCADKLCNYIIKYASENFACKDILKQISTEMYFSVSYLSRKFKENMGITFTDYLQKLRIEQSICLLANTNRKIIDIAGACGYSDMKSFNTVFKKLVGTTPQKFRHDFVN